VPLAVLKVNPAGGVMKRDVGSAADAVLPTEKTLLFADRSALKKMVSPTDASIVKTVMGRPVIVNPAWTGSSNTS
jgi:hypothetical protein